MSSGWQVPYEEPGPAPGVAFAGHGARLVAYVVDLVLIGLVITFLIVVGVLATVASARQGVGPAAVSSVLLFVAVTLVVSIGYFPFFWAKSGATPGMRMFGLWVVRDVDGGPISGGQAVLRLLGYWVSGVVFYLGYAWILIDKRRRGWHDLIAGTIVIQRR